MVWRSAEGALEDNAKKIGWEGNVEDMFERWDRIDFEEWEIMVLVC